MSQLESKAIALSLFARAAGLEVNTLDPSCGTISVVCWWHCGRGWNSEYISNFRQLRELINTLN